MTTEDVFIKIVLDAWHTQIKYTNDLFSELPDEQLMKEIAPGKNRGIYLLGHLTAVHDRMLPLLELGSSLYPQLWQPFVESPDKKVAELPDIKELRNYWNNVNEKLASGFSSFTPAQWLEKHTSVSEQDFAKEPHRNKLNIIINRTNHLANHLGQLLLLKPKDEVVKQ